jgi:hypothetical protein
MARYVFVLTEDLMFKPIRQMCITPAEEGARLREAMDVYPDVADPDGTSTVHWIEIGPTGVMAMGSYAQCFLDRVRRERLRMRGGRPPSRSSITEDPHG